MEYNLPQRVIRDITTFAIRHDIQKVVLFGSRARGTHRERSDVDIAVYGGDFDSFYWNIKEDIHSLLIFDVVDVCRGISADLEKEIERDGVIVYEKAIEQYRRITVTPEYRELERLRHKARHDEASALNNARRKGVEEGIEKGMVNTALKMIEKGLSFDEIKEFVDLPDEELKKLMGDKS